MKKVFADTGYWIALLNPNDSLRDKALQVTKELGNVIIVTSELVFVEVLNLLAKEDKELREAGATAVDELKRNPNAKIFPLSTLQFSEALKIYRSFNDKKWGLVDCSSFQIMESENIKEALAFDKHFQQQGYKALLRE